MAEKIFRVWPRFRPEGMVDFGDPVLQVRSAIAEVVLAAIFALPPIAHAMGMTPLSVMAMFGTHIACFLTAGRFLPGPARRSERAFRVMLLIPLAYNVGIAVFWVALGGDPKSPLWMGALLYACLTGAYQELDPNYVYLLTHALAPLLTIPLFLYRGANPGWSVAAPVVCGGLSALGYQMLAISGHRWRVVRAEQAAALAAVRRQLADAERDRIARELHDSVGSALGLVALYGELVERHLSDPPQLRRLASALKDATQEGIAELRGVMQALAPEACDLGGVAAAMTELGRRLSELDQLRLSVSVRGDRAAAIDPPSRLALVRVFQEAVHNALQHGGACRIDAELGRDEGSLWLTIKDDGIGFTGVPVEGRGLANMRTRARELGGSVEVSSQGGGGTEVRLALPFARASAGVSA